MRPAVAREGQKGAIYEAGGGGVKRNTRPKSSPRKQGPRTLFSVITGHSRSKERRRFRSPMPGDPRLTSFSGEDVDGRVKPGHDDVNTQQLPVT